MTRASRHIGFALAALGTLPALGAWAAPAAPEDPYAACMNLAARAPDEALNRAEALYKGGDRSGGQHCLAAALMAKGRPAEAGKVLDRLAGELPAERTEERTELLRQAGRAWLKADKAEAAIRSFGAALAISPDDAGLLMDRAVAKGARGELWEALDDLNRAAEIDPGDAEARLLMANAYRHLGSLDLAFENVEAALKIDAYFAGAWLERGVLHSLRGENAAAQGAFHQAVALDRDGPVGRAARANLARLSAGKGPSAPSPK